MTDPLLEIPAVPPTTEPLPVPASPVLAGRPEVHLTPRQWVRQNLFATWPGSVLTVVFGAVLAYAAYRLAWFALVSSDWEIVRRNLRLFMIGRFPVDQVWRLWTALYLVTAVVGLLGGAVVASAELQAQAAGRTVTRGGRWDGLRRYWPALAALVVVLAQTRTPAPALLTLAGAALLLASRWLGRRAPWLTRLSWLLLLTTFVGTVQIVSAGGGVGWRS